jgi:hypothetical protein
MFGAMIEGDQSRVMQDLRQKLSGVDAGVFLPPKFNRNGEMSMVPRNNTAALERISTCAQALSEGFKATAVPNSCLTGVFTYIINQPIWNDLMSFNK